MAKLDIKLVTDESFRRYGRIITEFDCGQLLEEMKKTPLPKDVIYVPSVAELQNLPIGKELEDKFYGGLPIQIGYCNGHNHLLNALEYHRSSELNVAVSDLILLVGAQQDIQADFTYDTDLVEGFLVPQGTVVDVYATTLHYAPCGVSGQGYRCVVVLPKDTNTELEPGIEKSGESALLFAKNKWLIGHSEAGLEKDGAFIGLKGKNISVE